MFELKHHEFAIQKSKKKNSFFKNSSNKSICESEKNSIIINSFVSFASLSLIFKKSCFICRIVVILIKKHYFEYFSCHETLRYKLKQQFARRTHQREQKTQKQIELIEQKFRKRDFHFSINAINLICEIKKTSFVSHKLFILFAKFQKFIFEFATTFKTIILLKFSKFSFFTFEIKLELTKKSTTCRRCNRIFNFNNKFHDYIRKHHVWKFVKNLNFRVFTSKFIYKIIEKSTNM